MAKISFNIEGMNCMHCVGKVEKALTEKPGVEKVKVQLKKEEAKVKYDDNVVTSDQLIEVIKEAGYKATTK